MFPSTGTHIEFVRFVRLPNNVNVFLLSKFSLACCNLESRSEEKTFGQLRLLQLQQETLAVIFKYVQVHQPGNHLNSQKLTVCLSKCTFSRRPISDSGCETPEKQH